MSEHIGVEIKNNILTEDSVSIFGYELIREVLIPEILGVDAPDILYWAGKKIARIYPLDNISEIIVFFKDAGWGNLTVTNETKNEMELELSSTIITKRMQDQTKPHFQLEAGFLAEQIEKQRQVVTEAFEHTKKRTNKVFFTVKWDSKDSI